MNETNYIERYWRDAKPEDAIKEPPMVARFRQDGEDWVHTEVLLGYDRSQKDFVWCCTFPNAMLRAFKYCQVYDAPDPGEGWRLIDPDKDDCNQVGIEFWHTSLRRWQPRPVRFQKTPFEQSNIYRIRIAPPVTYVPFTWEDRDQLRGRIITFVDRNRTVEFRCESFSVDDDGFLVNDTYANWLCKNAVFVDTKESVGKKVTQ